GFVGAAFNNVIDGGHGGQHRVVLVVVLVHAVAADKKQVLEVIYIVADFTETVISPEIGGIRLRDVNHTAIENISRVDDADLRHLSLREIDHLFIGKAPDGIGLITEIFEATQTLLGSATRCGLQLLKI